MLTLATLAESTDSLDDNFFAHLIKILPYNLTTLKKLVDRLLKNDRMSVLDASVEELHVTIKDLVDSEMKGVDMIALQAAMPVPVVGASADAEVKIESMYFTLIF